MPATAPSTRGPRVARVVLMGLLGVVALNALGAGAAFVAAPSGALLGMQKAVLAGTPFGSFLVPGLVLFVVVGGSALVALVALLRRHRQARLLGEVAALALLGWMAVQLALLGVISALQPALVVTGLVELLLCRLMPRAPT